VTQTLAQRRREMIARAASQRTMLAKHIHQLHRPIELADRARAIVRYLKARPLLAILPAGVFAFRRPRTLLRWFSRGWLTKEIIRKLLIR
jgi:YqjK-like protein